MDWQPITLQLQSKPALVDAGVASIDTTSPLSGIIASIATPKNQINIWQDTRDPPSLLDLDAIQSELAQLAPGFYSSPSLKIMAEIT